MPEAVLPERILNLKSGVRKGGGVYFHGERRGVYKELMDRVRQRGASLDDVLRELLDRAENVAQEKTDPPAEKLLKLIDATELPFDYALNARDAEDHLSRETGAVS